MQKKYAETFNLLEKNLDIKGRSLWSDSFRRLIRNRLAVTGFMMLTVIIALVLLGPWLEHFDMATIDWGQMSTPPQMSSGHYFGTDSVGRDIFARTLYGGRISLMVGLVATVVSVIIGVLYGAIAGFLGGKLDALLMRIVDILYALPTMFFIILLTVIFGHHIVLIFIAIGATSWLDMARIVRGQTLSLKRKEFVEAAHACGVRPMSIICRHIVPNLLGIIIVYVTLTIPSIIISESVLSFLGLGVQEPATSWGVLVNDGSRDMEGAWWALVFPALFLAATLFCFNFIGDGLRDALDPKDR